MLHSMFSVLFTGVTRGHCVEGKCQLLPEDIFDLLVFHTQIINHLSMHRVSCALLLLVRRGRQILNRVEWPVFQSVLWWVAMCSMLWNCFWWASKRSSWGQCPEWGWHHDTLPFAATKVSVCHAKVEFHKKFEDPLAILIHIANSMMTNLMWPGGMISTNHSIEIAEDEHALCRGDLMHNTLEFIIKGIFLPSEAITIGAYTMKIVRDPLAAFNSSFMRCSELDVGGLRQAVRLLCTAKPTPYIWCSSVTFPFQKIVYSASQMLPASSRHVSYSVHMSAQLCSFFVKFGSFTSCVVNIWTCTKAGQSVQTFQQVRVRKLECFLGIGWFFLLWCSLIYPRRKQVD